LVAWPPIALRYSVLRSSGIAGSNAISSASAGGTVTTACRAVTWSASLATITRSPRWEIERTGAERCSAARSSSAKRCATSPAPP
jgi:hypothetical protein